MHSWQTEGAVCRVSFVSPVRRGATVSGPLDVVDDHVHRLRPDVGHALEVVADAALDVGRDGLHVRAVVDDHVHLDLVARDACATTLLGVHAPHLGCRVGRVPPEHLGRDVAVAFHHAPDLRTSSVASGRAKKRNGTKVVPSPGETCIVVAPRRKRPSAYGARGWASRSFPKPYGSTICPAWRWPARIRSHRPGGTRSSASGKWQSRIRNGADGPPKPLPRLASHERGATPPISTGTPRSSTSSLSSASSLPAGSDVSSAGRENGSRETFRSWFPSTTYGCPRRLSSPSSLAAPRGRESRSPVTQTRSGRRSST